MQVPGDAKQVVAYTVIRNPVEPIVLKVENLSDPDLVRNVSFELRRGEILGVAGLMGAGRSEMAEILVGLRGGTGTVVFDGQPFHQRGAIPA